MTTLAGKFCTVQTTDSTNVRMSEACLSDGNGTQAGISTVRTETVTSHLQAGKLGDKLYFTDYGNNIVRKIECGPFDVMAMLYGECFLPTNAPTQAPVYPTYAPTSKPSPKPSYSPTVAPSFKPTFAPSVSSKPSISPTASTSSPTYTTHRSGYIYYPFAPNALYQSGINVSFVSGRSRYFQEEAGFGSQGSYNGVLGITFDETEKWGFLTSADGKEVRKLNLRTTYLPPDITSKIIINLIQAYNSIA